jgi:uncharacterized membrane protein YdcZ (DUF606 family)
MEKMEIIALLIIVGIVISSVGAAGVSLSAQGTTTNYASIAAIVLGTLVYVSLLYCIYKNPQSSSKSASAEGALEGLDEPTKS